MPEQMATASNYHSRGIAGLLTTTVTNAPLSFLLQPGTGLMLLAFPERLL